jgi:hypothetical protein
MADLKLVPTNDPDVILVIDGDAPAYAVSAAEAGRLVAAAQDAEAKPVKKAAAKKAAKRG